MLRYSASRSAVYTACDRTGPEVKPAGLATLLHGSIQLQPTWSTIRHHHSLSFMWGLMRSPRCSVKQAICWSFSSSQLCSHLDNEIAMPACNLLHVQQVALYTHLDDGVVVRQRVEVVVEHRLADDVQREAGK